LSRFRWGIFGACVALVIAPALARADEFKWDIPDVVADVDVPGVMLATGIPVKMHAVVSKRHYQDVAAYVVKSFEKQGLYIAPPSHQPQVTREPQLTGLDPQRKISYTVILQPNKDGTTTVILGEANLGKVQNPDGPDFAPLYPGAKNVLRTDVEAMKTVIYDVGAPRAEVEAFYQESLKRAGYAPASLGSFRKGADEIQLQVSTKEGRTLVWLAHRVAGERSPSPP
jgi:hypothetical protein